MKTFLLIAIIYGLFVAFNFWSFIGAEKKLQGDEPITNGGMVFCAVMSLLGPLGIGASLYSLGDGRIESWADRPFRSKKQKGDQE